jgi:isopropylmalate/homocitrate/citramalate synthase
MPYRTGVDSTKIMNISRKVATVSGFAVQFNKAIVGKNAFLHESGIHQDGMLKNAETFEIMRPTDIGLSETNLVMGKHSGRAALRSKLRDLGFELADNQLALNSEWDKDLLGVELGDLADAGFDVSLAGFDDEDKSEEPGSDALEDVGIDRRFWVSIQGPIEAQAEALHALKALAKVEGIEVQSNLVG